MQTSSKYGILYVIKYTQIMLSHLIFVFFFFLDFFSSILLPYSFKFIKQRIPIHATPGFIGIIVSSMYICHNKGTSPFFVIPIAWLPPIPLGIQ